MTFAKAVKEEAKLRLAIAGPSGSGKTYTSLAIATALADGKPIALVDTEHGSASKYADLFPFDVLELTAPFHPERFIAAIQEAGKAGYAVLILDSLSHAWNGAGGLLEIVDDIAKRMKTTNTFTAWKDATPLQTRMVEAILEAPLHIIATMRSKQEYILTADEKGKQVPRKVGMAPVQREGFEYEFDVFLDMDIDNTGIVSKTRCPALTGGVFKKPGANVAGILAAWLHGAARTAPESNGQPAQPTPRMPAVLREHLRNSAHANANEPELTVGWRDGLIGTIDKMTEPNGHHAFLAWAFDSATGSRKDITNGQLHALKGWLQTHSEMQTVEGKNGEREEKKAWVLNEIPAAELLAAYPVALAAHRVAPAFPAAEDLHPASAHLEPA